MDSTSNPLKWAFALLAIALAAAAAGIAAFYFEPVGIGMALARQGLGRIGLERHTLEAPTGRLVYWIGGSGGETVVLVHGMGNQAGSWVKVAADLARRSELVIPDLPGHGDSEPTRGPLGLGQEVAGLGAVVDAVSPIEPVTLVGNSMGGWVSMLYAADHPDRVAHLVLLSSAGLEHDLGEIELVPETPEEARRLVAAMSPPGAPMPADFVLRDLVETIAEGASPRLVEGFDPVFLVDRRAERITTPADVVWGSEDRLLPPELGRRLAALLPRARYFEIEGCGHIPQQQCPRALVELLEDLLAGPDPADYPGAPALR